MGFCASDRYTHLQSLYRGRILGRNPDKSHSHLYSFAVIIRFLQTHPTSNVFLQFSYCTLYRRKEENLIENPTPFPMVPYRNFKSENSQDYAQKTSVKSYCPFMNLVSCQFFKMTTLHCLFEVLSFSYLYYQLTISIFLQNANRAKVSHNKIFENNRN